MFALSKGTAVLALIAFSLSPVTTAMRQHSSPVQKVLAALGNMKAKGQTSMEVEKKVFEEYSEWVDDRSKELGNEIESGKANIEKLTAFIDKADNKVAKLGKEIAVFDADIGRMESEKKDAQNIRDKEHAEYEKVAKDYADSVDAMQRAIQVLTAEDYDRPQAEALLQKMAKTSVGMQRVVALLEEKKQAPEVAAYEFQSGGITEMLEKLLDKFKAELASAEEQEGNEVHNFKLEELHLTNMIKKAGEDRDAKAALKAETAAATAKAKGDLFDEKRELAADEATLSEMVATHQTKSEVFAQNQKVRKEEMEALAKAMEILSSPDVAGSYKEHVSLAAEASRAATPGFLQLRSKTHRLDARGQALALLRRRGSALGSTAMLALTDQATANPFAKVITLIKDLLTKLQEEAAAEADHKAWCDKELKSNKIKREKRAATVEQLSAQIESLTIDISDMGKTISTLSKEQADLATAMKEATDQRLTEQAKNEDTIKDAQVGAEAVKKALEVLKEFYSSQMGTELVQTAAKGGEKKQVPEMEAYTGQQGGKKGVVGLLEVILADFVRLSSETKAAEGEASREYENFMKSAEADKKAKGEREANMKLKKDQAEFELGQMKKDLKSADAELLKANMYYESLKPNCVQVHVTHEERAGRREQEIEALKEAYDILDHKVA